MIAPVAAEKHYKYAIYNWSVLQFRNTQQGLKASSSSLQYEDASMMLILKECALASYNDG